jgi:putative glutamine amidotransferase
VSSPVIGVCAMLETASWGPWTSEADMVPRTYTDAVQRAGAIALILPADDALAQAPELLLDRLDGLLLAGGADIDPAAYGAEPHPEVGHTRPERDRFELALAHRALERELPLLGICRGMELLNVACGGTLEPHLERLDLHRHTPGTFCDHEVRLEPGSLAAGAAGSDRLSVRSHHHQGLAELGDGLVASGWSEPDGLVEAVEAPERRFALGVLWHPEEDVRAGVVGALVEAARAEVGAR